MGMDVNIFLLLFYRKSQDLRYAYLGGGGVRDKVRVGRNKAHISNVTSTGRKLRTYMYIQASNFIITDWLQLMPIRVC